MFGKRNYNKSNRIQDIDIPISSTAKALAKLLLHDTTINRQELSQQLLDELTDLAKIDIVNVTVSEEHQRHKKAKGRVVFKQYGYYRPSTRSIHIHNKTAVRGQVLAPKSFVDTLLHEWLHHYDYQKLGINSIHSSGFYARLKDIKEKIGYFHY